MLTEVASLFLILCRYEFRTKHYDLAFSNLKLNDDGSREEVLERQRYNCQMVPEDGHIMLQQPGTCKYMKV